MSQNIDICFYNLFHIGDAYITSLFMNLICKANPDIVFYYYITKGDTFFSHIENTNKIDDVNLIQQINSLERRTPYKLVSYDTQKKLCINTWSTALGHNDYDIIDAFEKWNEMINKLNIEFGMDIKFDIKKCNMLHPIKFQAEQKFIDFKNNTNLNITFVYNFDSLSVPFHKNYIHHLINVLAKNIENKILIIPFYNSNYPVHKNILYLDRDFNIYPDSNCDNLLKTWEIAKKCNSIVITTCGACWLFFDEDIYNIPNILYYHSNDKYTHNADVKLNDNIKYFTNSSRNIIKSLHTQNICK